MTANIFVVLVFDPGARIVPDRLLSVGLLFVFRLSLPSKNRADPRARAPCLWRGKARSVKKPGGFWCPLLGAESFITRWYQVSLLAGAASGQAGASTSLPD